jgi:hypothetical protein
MRNGQRNHAAHERRTCAAVFLWSIEYMEHARRIQRAQQPAAVFDDRRARVNMPEREIVAPTPSSAQ